MPMNSNFTKQLEELENYSLQMIDLFSQLPDSFFDDPLLQPPSKVINSIISYSKGDPVKTDDTDKLFRFNFN